MRRHHLADSSVTSKVSYSFLACTVQTIALGYMSRQSRKDSPTKAAEGPCGEHAPNTGGRPQEVDGASMRNLDSSWIHRLLAMMVVGT
jgi:hypothetical protein